LKRTSRSWKGHLITFARGHLRLQDGSGLRPGRHGEEITGCFLRRHCL
jgi:hypothetical protein